jgi:hypothetical protein
VIIPAASSRLLDAVVVGVVGPVDCVEIGRFSSIFRLGWCRLGPPVELRWLCFPAPTPLSAAAPATHDFPDGRENRFVLFER